MGKTTSSMAGPLEFVRARLTAVTRVKTRLCACADISDPERGCI